MIYLMYSVKETPNTFAIFSIANVGPIINHKLMKLLTSIVKQF